MPPPAGRAPVSGRAAGRPCSPRSPAPASVQQAALHYPRQASFPGPAGLGQPGQPLSCSALVTASRTTPPARDWPGHDAHRKLYRRQSGRRRCSWANCSAASPSSGRRGHSSNGTRPAIDCSPGEAAGLRRISASHPGVSARPGPSTSAACSRKARVNPAARPLLFKVQLRRCHALRAYALESTNCHHDHGLRRRLRQ
jgi:hypothetical protein